jgi:diaminopimelate epimerase
MAEGLEFAKYEGIGNDFVIVDGRRADLTLAARHAVALCDRHRGVGADGVLLLDVGATQTVMRVINADGSRPEMCGNGIRCAALYLAHTGAVRDGAIEIQTDAGPHRCRVFQEGAEELVEVGMRAASLEPADVPVTAAAPVLEEPFEVDGESLRLTCVSMGNPHGVSFDEAGLDPRVRARLGPRLEKHARFPHGANIGFARMLEPTRIALAVWERGVGWTEACGTGACACAVAAVETGRSPRQQPIEVQLPGGTLRVLVPERGASVQMTGPARRVFEGRLEL